VTSDKENGSAVLQFELRGASNFSTLEAQNDRVYSKKKMDIGKSCLRFKNPEDVTVELIGNLASKISPQEWITF